MFIIGILDCEVDDKYFFLVRIKDGGIFFLLLDVIVNIKLMDINDNVFVFWWLFYFIVIFENLIIGINFFFVGVFDDDLGINLEIIYEIDILFDDNFRVNLYFGVYGINGNIFLRWKVDREVD